MTNSRAAVKSSKATGSAAHFSEAQAWNVVGAGWRPRLGGYGALGFRFEWHEFTSAKELDWARSFHPGSVELCLNLDGEALVADAQNSVELPARSCAFYYQGQPVLTASRRASQPHRFITVEFSPSFLQQHFDGQEDSLHPLV